MNLATFTDYAPARVQHTSLGTLGVFGGDPTWWWFEGWVRSGGKWVRTYQAGPARMLESEADTGFQSQLGDRLGTTYHWVGLWEWDGARWLLRDSAIVQSEQGNAPPLTEPPPPPALDTATKVADFPEWDSYLLALRNSLVNSWNDATRAYKALQEVRQILGLPFVMGAEGGTSDEALSWSENQRWLEMAAIVPAMTQIADDALAGIRKVGYNPATGDFLIEVLPGDTVLFQQVNREIVMVDRQTGQPTHAKGTIGIWPYIAILAIVALTY